MNGSGNNTITKEQQRNKELNTLLCLKMERLNMNQLFVIFFIIKITLLLHLKFFKIH